MSDIGGESAQLKIDLGAQVHLSSKVAVRLVLVLALTALPLGSATTVLAQEEAGDALGRDSLQDAEARARSLFPLSETERAAALADLSAQQLEALLRVVALDSIMVLEQQAGESKPRVVAEVPCPHDDQVPCYTPDRLLNINSLRVPGANDVTRASNARVQLVTPFCTSATNTVVGQNILKTTLWTYSHRVSWCADGSTVYNVVTPDRGTPEIKFPLWYYVGELQPFTNVIPEVAFLTQRQGQFRVCLTNGIGCYQECIPYIDHFATPQGVYEGHQSG